MTNKRDIQRSTHKHSILIIPFVFLMTLLASFNALSQQSTAQKYEAGVHYDVLEYPVRTRDKTKVEVVEVFWYGCSHCYNFDPLVEKWKQKQNTDVDFWRSPAIWNPTMKLHAQAFFTAKALGVLEKVHTPLFTTLVVERKRLSNKQQIAALFSDYGVDKKKFSKTFDSFGVNSQVTQADARARSYKVTGTPELVVNGKYRISAKAAGGQAQMLKIADYLVAKERAQLAVK